MRDWKKKDKNDAVVIFIDNKEEYEDFMDIAEYEYITWASGRPAKRVNAYEPSMYIRISAVGTMTYGRRALSGISATVFARDLHNYAVQIRINRGEV